MVSLKRTTQKTCLDTFYLSHQKGKSLNRIYLLLHGYSQTGEYIFNKLENIIPDNSLIVSPNGPYPLIEKKETYYKKRFAWYFYDNFQDEYYIFPQTAAELVSGLLKDLNPGGIPVTIIGFSQGGYLAPYIGGVNSDVDHVIGIGSVFREMILDHGLDFRLDAIHGVDDKIVSMEKSQIYYNKIIKHAQGGSYYSLKGSEHSLDKNVLSKLNELLVY